MKLHLGCSDDYKPGYVNVDITPAPLNLPAGMVYQRVDLNKPWPWANSSVDEIVAHDVFEHLAGFYGSPGKVWAMNESWRVLKPGGLLDLAVPSVAMANRKDLNIGAFADPTHRTFWTWDDVFYFANQFNTPEFERGRLGPAYGINAVFEFPVLEESAQVGWREAKRQPDLTLQWQVVNYGETLARRAKLVGKLKAVK